MPMYSERTNIPVSSFFTLWRNSDANFFDTFHPSFIQRMGELLEADWENIFNGKLPRKLFEIFSPDGPGNWSINPQFTDENIGYFHITLIGPDNKRYNIPIFWGIVEDREKKKYRICLPGQELTEEDKQKLSAKFGIPQELKDIFQTRYIDPPISVPPYSDNEAQAKKSKRMHFLNLWKNRYEPNYPVKDKVFSLEFIEALEAELQEDWQRQFSGRLKVSGFFLMPQSGDAKDVIPLYTSKNIGFLFLNILGKDSYAHNTIIAWTAMAKNNPDRYLKVDPYGNLPKDAVFHAWFYELPWEILLEQYGTVIPLIQWKSKTFSLVWETVSYPDLIFTFTTKDACTEEMIEKAFRTFSKDVDEKWNRKHSGDVIHYIGEVKKQRKNAYAVHIDFGNAGMGALEFVLKEFEKIQPLLGITKVKVS